MQLKKGTSMSNDCLPITCTLARDTKNSHHISLSAAVPSISSLPSALLNKESRICVAKQDAQIGGADPIWCWMFREHRLQGIEAASLSSELFSPKRRLLTFTNTNFMSRGLLSLVQNESSSSSSSSFLKKSQLLLAAIQEKEWTTGPL